MVAGNVPNSVQASVKNTRDTFGARGGTLAGLPTLGSAWDCLQYEGPTSRRFNCTLSVSTKESLSKTKGNIEKRKFRDEKHGASQILFQKV